MLCSHRRNIVKLTKYKAEDLFQMLKCTADVYLVRNKIYNM